MMLKRYYCYFCRKNMILVVDCGSSKSRWAVIDETENEKRWIGVGFNPNYKAIEDIKLDIAENIKNVYCKDIDTVYFYGTGCSTEDNKNKIAKVFKELMPETEIVVESDMMAACHALFGREKGMACIMGTGSNACIYDGKDIECQAVSLGYILGDEGSGCYLGKILLHDYFYEIMPCHLRNVFHERFSVTRDDVIRNVYQKQQASRYLASFAVFLSENFNDDYVITLCENSFKSFFDYYVLKLNGNHEYNLGFVGSVAYCFEDLLRKTASSYSFKVVKVLSSPVEELKKYYKGII